MISFSSALAFDGQRKGFVIGGGLGLGFAGVSSDDWAQTDMENMGYSFNFGIGYAWSEENMIVFLVEGVSYYDDYDGYEDIYMSQSFGGFGYYHYFGMMGNSPFIKAGLGLQG